MDAWVERALARALDKVVAQHTLRGYPHITEQGQWLFTPDGVWTGGFWIGLLWAAYEHSGDPAVRARAEQLLEDFMPHATATQNHDLGFMFCPAAVAGWDITGDERYRAAALQAAESLAAQFHPAGRFIPGWGFFGAQTWQGSGLIDTMMNLPLLLWASAQTGNARYREIALLHAETALRYHVRADGSTYHVYQFDPDSGAPLRGDTYQGRDAESCWSRGQGWAIAGFALLAERTGEARYQEVARRAADYYLNHLPPDLVPSWDFSVPAGEGPRDSSAAAIAAFGLLHLAALEASGPYEEAASWTLRVLSAEYLTPPDAPAILAHATADLPHGLGIDESTNYGDYFYVRALQTLARRPAKAGGCL